MFEINDKNSKFITMDAWGITDGKSKKSVLKTYNIVSCVGISFYNVETKQAVLIHIAIELGKKYIITKQVIKLIIKTLTRDNKIKLNVNIVANNDKDSILSDIFPILVSHKNIVLNKIINSSMLAIDAKTGEISTSFLITQKELYNANFVNNFNLLPSFIGVCDIKTYEYLTKFKKGSSSSRWKYCWIRITSNRSKFNNTRTKLW